MWRTEYTTEQTVPKLSLRFKIMTSNLFHDWDLFHDMFYDLFHDRDLFHDLFHDCNLFRNRTY